MRVEFDRYSLRIDGERVLIRSGSLHYFRLPSPALWRDRIAKMKDAGLNAVDVYYPWNYHSAAPGDYDWSGIRDVERLHDMIEAAGLYLIARPGPYICAELDLGGLPAWLLRDSKVFPRCRVDGEYSYSRDFVTATREWFEQVVPRFSGRSNLCLVQIENEYTVPTPLSGLPNDLLELLVRWFGMRALGRLSNSSLARRLLLGEKRVRPGGRLRGQSSGYMRDLYDMARSLGVSAPIFHNDIAAGAGRQADVDMIALDRYPLVRFDRDWRDDRRSFDAFRGDEQALDAHGVECPAFYPELQGGWYDGWGGVGYGRLRELLGPEGIDNVSKAALAERATLWNYYMFCGGVTWGYQASPDVYSSYDYGAPIGESGRTGPRYEAVRRLNEFLAGFEEELCQTDVIDEKAWCKEHLRSRQGATRRFVFLRNASRESRELPMPEQERRRLAPWETQIRVYGPSGVLEAVSPELPERVAAPAAGVAPALPDLERWEWSGASPQLDPSYDNSGWSEIPAALVEQNRMDIDTLGLHYGFVWYRGTYQRPLDRLELDARHCWAVWINRELAAAGDQFQNPLGVGPDGARIREIPLSDLQQHEGRNVIVILVESLGHHKGFADDFANPRGVVRLDTGATRVAWRHRGGLVRGERGLTPVVAFEGVERSQVSEVVLPHAWAGEPAGVGLYETRFELEGVDPKSAAVGLCFDPGRGKANLYLNGHLVGRYWPERGPQRKFLLPWGILHPDEENHLAVALWKRTDRAALGRLRLELM